MLKDVARQAGVSITTASAALNATGRVGPETRQRIQEVAAEIGYRPSTAARLLKKGSQGRVVALITRRYGPFGRPAEHLPDPPLYWPRLFGAFFTTLAENSIQCLQIPADHLDMLAQTPVDLAIIVNPRDREAAHPPHIPLGVPRVVAAGTREIVERSEADGYVLADVTASTYEALDHLVAHGAHHPALIYEVLPMAPLDDFIAAYEDWCARRGFEALKFQGVSAAAVDHALSAGADAFYVKGSDVERSAQKVVDVLSTRGLAVPDDILVVSNSDDVYESTVPIPITTVTYDGVRTGRELAHSVIECLRSGAPVEVEIAHDLRVRKSTQR